LIRVPLGPNFCFGDFFCILLWEVELNSGREDITSTEKNHILRVSMMVESAVGTNADCRHNSISNLLRLVKI